MSRFNSLEFGEQFDDQLPQQRELVKGEAFYMAEARAAFENANFEQGLRLYSKVLEFNPENASAWTGQVRMLIELGEFREAKLWADKALERFPHEPELLAAKAVALGRSGDLQGALAFSDASIEERGDTPYIWLARGDVLMAREETRGAHSRSDFPKQRDDYGLFNSYLRRGSEGKPEIEKKPVEFKRKSLEECQQYRK